MGWIVETIVLRVGYASWAGPLTGAFLPSTGPSGFGRNEHYASQADYLEAVSEAFREEYTAILDAGFVLQVDDPWLIEILTDENVADTAERQRRGQEHVDALEHPELIADTLETYARLVGRERVIAGADCDCSSRATFHPEVHPTIVLDCQRVRARCPSMRGVAAGRRQTATVASRMTGIRWWRTRSASTTYVTRSSAA